MENNIYPFSVFFFTKSVFDEVGKNNQKAIELIFKAILMNTRFRDIIKTNITFTSKEIMEKVKEEDYIKKFKGFMVLGKNIAYPEDDNDIRGGDINFRLVQHAINKDGDILGLVKIVAEESSTEQNIRKIIEEDNYPLGIVSCEEALEELDVIEKRLTQTFVNFKYSNWSAM